MKTKQITLENIKNKEELKDYIIDNVRDDINYAIKNGEYNEPDRETVDNCLHETIDIMCISTVNCEKFIKILEEEGNFNFFKNGTCCFKDYQQAARFALDEFVRNEVNIYLEV
tara:strand:+ start:7134 stop:7472 length:339 start_codon:yes stop_codon:yes gene_type:complete